jgi:hypothetical protein
MLSYEERSQMYDLEALERVSKKDMVWNKFVEVTRVSELQWDEYVYEYWNQLRRNPMYVKSMMSVGNSETNFLTGKRIAAMFRLSLGLRSSFRCPLALSIL